ncbi:MAG TPA: carboxypeptidase regulatory-like domain-containing protein [Thermoplasmatales archaeon]|nr:carboxypeptidase regulatory-like domain-containing protein [Thermoplasmatales archaeon]
MRKTKLAILITCLLLTTTVFVTVSADARNKSIKCFIKKNTVSETVTLTVAVYKRTLISFGRPEPIAGAKVSAISQVHSASGVTNGNGMCHLEILPNVYYTLTVSKKGYQSLTIGVVVSSNAAIVVFLKKTIQNNVEHNDHFIPLKLPKGIEVLETC